MNGGKAILIILAALFGLSLIPDKKKEKNPNKKSKNGSSANKKKKEKKMARKVFFSFHFDNDVMRVQQVINIGAIEGNKPVSSQEWEEAGKTPNGIKNWIDANLKDKSCLVVLIGKDTSTRPWVDYEIRKAWNDGKGVLGIYIHNLKCPRNGKSTQGNNPFDNIGLQGSNNKLSSLVKVYHPDSEDAYNGIKDNIEKWVETAIAARK